MPRELISKPFGKITIQDRQVLQFPEGLLGFEEYKEFALIEEREDSPFKWLQSTTEPGLAFVLIQPELFAPSYAPLIPIEELDLLGLASVSESIVFVIVTIPQDNPKSMTANLQGPILINPKNLTARQLISRSDRHPLRASIMSYNEEANEPVKEKV